MLGLNDLLTPYNPSKTVKELNEDANVHGILVQVPLPEHMNEYKVLDVISREKDVDGFHPLNIGMFFNLIVLFYNLNSERKLSISNGARYKTISPNTQNTDFKGLC